MKSEATGRERSLRILLLHWGGSGGGPRHLYELAEACSAYGQDDYLVSYNRDSEIASSIENLDLPSLSVTTYSTRLGVILKLPKLLANALRLRRFIRHNDIDVVVSSMNSLWQSIGIYAYLPREVIYIASVHDASSHPGDEHPLKAVCHRIDIGRADALLAYSRGVEKTLSASTGKPVRSTVLAASRASHIPSEGRRLDSSGPVVLGFFGRILEYKGIDILIASAEILEERGFDVIVRVYGTGDVESLVHIDGASRVEWNLGWVREDQVNSTVASMDIVVLPYREASQSGVLTVALAEGVPTVVTPVGSLADQVAETGGGLVADRVDADAVADAIARLICDRALYEQLSRDARESARSTFSWRRVVDDFTSITHEFVAAGETVRPVPGAHRR